MKKRTRQDVNWPKIIILVLLTVFGGAGIGFPVSDYIEEVQERDRNNGLDCVFVVEGIERCCKPNTFPCIYRAANRSEVLTSG